MPKGGEHMNTLTINRLPSRTWNFLRVNETALS